MNLSDLLHDVVDGVDPADRLAEIRARTASSRTRTARRWYAAGGAALATAAAVTAFAVVSPDSPDRAGPATPTTDTQLVAVYFIGDTPDGPRLYREFDRVPAGDPLQGALGRIQQPPADPDYRTAWRPGSRRSEIGRAHV